MANLKVLLDLFHKGRKAVIDSRKVSPGDIFFCIKGDKTDAHLFLEEVKNKGASLAVVSKEYSGSTFGLDLIVVEDPLKTMQEVAQEIQSLRTAIVVAVTGSVGKTTTKEYIAKILSQKFKVGKSLGNANSQIGLALTLLNDLKNDDEIVVLEMGMSEAGQIKRLVEMAPPTVAIITAIAYVHAANFDSLENIKNAKAEIFLSPKTEFAVLGPKAQNFNYNFLKNLKFADPSRLNISMASHFKENLACAIEVAHFFNLSMNEIEAGIVECLNPDTLLENRFKLSCIRGVYFLNDSYNASEASLMAALEAMPKPLNKGKTVAVIGEMLELGKFSEECHTRVAQKILQKINCLYLVGEGCWPIQRAFEEAGLSVQIYPSAESVVNNLRLMVKADDVVLLKGSRFWQLDHIEKVF